MPFAKKVRFSSTFEGVVVKAVMRPLDFIDALEVDSAEVKPKSDSKEDKEAAMEQTIIGLAKILIPRLPGYVESLEGVLDEDGDPVPVDQVCRVAYFASLATDMALTLIRAANPGFQAPPVASGS